MKIVVFSLSTRSDSQSLKVAKYLKGRLKGLEQEVQLLDLNELKLPIYDVTGEGEWTVRWTEVSSQLEAADGFVAVSPEWDGMAGPGWFNLMHYVKKEMAHKPVMLVGVSSGRGGTYPLALMRMAGPKNSHFIVSPENLIVGSAEDMLNDDDMDENAGDYAIKQRAEYSLKILCEYAKALKPIRSSSTIDYKQFGNGV